jgi:5-methyltetrahydrofolate--homocysteine methyltransferase
MWESGAMPRRMRETGSPALRLAAREMRHQPTLGEHLLWQALRKNALNGFRFRRQVVVGPYIVDFFSLVFGLAVEVDGHGHESEDQKIYDEQRTEYLNSRNIQVLRFTNDQVENDLPGVLSTIEAWLSSTRRR